VIVAIFSDVHGNLPALERFVEATRSTADAYLCLGDVVNYGPWNDECLEIVRSLPGIVYLQGNHERLFLEIDDPKTEKPLVRDFYSHSRRFFSRKELLGDLAATCDLGDYRCTHTIDGRYVYADTRIEISRNYIIGHSHHQFEILRGGRRLVNSGSVGQNRSCIDVISYLLFDSTTGKPTLCEEPSPIDQFVRELVARQYPKHCVDYYLSKRRRFAACTR
jgi:predicted phosphodiesterase